jgi:hypothetical protein
MKFARVIKFYYITLQCKLIDMHNLLELMHVHDEHIEKLRNLFFIFSFDANNSSVAVQLRKCNILKTGK